MKTFVLLGGYGGAGRALAPLLLSETNARLIIAGRNQEKAQRLADALAVGHPGRVTAAMADAAQPKSVEALLQGSAMLIDLTPNSARSAAMARAALEAEADYLDIHFQANAFNELAPLACDFEARGRLLITQAGSHPGLPAALVRAAAQQFDQYHSALVGMALRMRVENATTALELVDEIMTVRGALFADGAWREARNSDTRTLDLGPRFGLRMCYPMRMVELEPLPEALGLRETGVWVAGFNPIVDWLLIPFMLLCGKLSLRFARPLLARLFTWGVNAFTVGEPGMSICIEAVGLRLGQPATCRIVLDHPNPYVLTTIPVAGCLLQYLDGEIAKPGLHIMGQAVNPRRLLKDMARMGINVSVEGLAT
ncbi:MAG: saccharopine dehydrogenase NADP-binding domain-containing protein [Proteobacteria bacterium]|nr:saccharopine dehydrogenase NADP-binding domain-containing protein [Pseudomonadota bacterium]